MNGHVALVSAGLSGILAGLCGAAVAASGPLGSELQINSYTTDDQIQSAVAVAPSGDFVVVWISPQDGEFKGVFAQRVAGSGAFQGVELQINGYTLGNQLAPSVATDADGDFIVTWASSQDGDSTGAFARRFDSAGSPVASELQINTYTTGSQTVPSIAASGNGAFVVAWQSQGQDGDDNGIFLRRFSSLGAALGGELQVNTYTTGTQNDPAIALRGGEFVVVWSDYDGHDGDGIGVFGQRFDFAIGPLGAEFQLSTRTAGSQVSPAVAMTGNGEFVVVWQSPGDAFFGTGIFGRRYDSSGAELGLEFLVNGHTADSQFSPAVSSSGDGGFTVVWESNLTDGSFTGIFGRDFDSLGAPLAVEFQVNTYTQLGQHGAAIAMNGAGRFAVSWVSDEQDGDTYGVFARRFAPATATPTVTLTPTSTRTPTPTSTPTVTPTPSVTPTPLPLTLDVDGNGVASPLTDGLLVLRFQFSFTGATLVNGAVDLGGCSRCTATDIANYLSGLGLTLDIDGNGTAGALTDGLLVIRFLFGFTGTTLTNGVVGAGCSRCDASTIVPYLETLN